MTDNSVRFTTPCGKVRNSKGEHYTHQGYLNHVASCPRCQRIVNARHSDMGTESPDINSLAILREIQER